jgi:hypothetical protein
MKATAEMINFDSKHSWFDVSFTRDISYYGMVNKQKVSTLI